MQHKVACISTIMGPVFGFTKTGAPSGCVLAVIYYNKAKYTLKQRFTDDAEGYTQINALYDRLVSG